MPLISKSYITKNDYYMKIGDINVSDFDIVVFFWSRQTNISYLCIVLIKNDYDIKIGHINR